MSPPRPRPGRAPDRGARPGVLRLARGLLLAPLLTASAFVTSAGAAGPVALTTEQQARLAGGEIVVLEARPDGASPGAGGGTAVALVPAPVERVWGVLTDYPGHPRYYPGVVAAEVLEVSGPRVLVRYTVRVGLFTFRFHMRKVSDPGRRRIEWRLAEDRANGLLRENSGYWLVEPRPGQPRHLRDRGAKLRAGLPDRRKRAGQPRRHGGGAAASGGGRPRARRRSLSGCRMSP